MLSTNGRRRRRRATSLVIALSLHSCKQDGEEDEEGRKRQGENWEENGQGRGEESSTRRQKALSWRRHRRYSRIYSLPLLLLFSLGSVLRFLIHCLKFSSGSAHSFIDLLIKRDDYFSRVTATSRRWSNDVCCFNQLSIQKEEAKKKEVLVEENVPAPSPRSNCSVRLFAFKDWNFLLSKTFHFFAKSVFYAAYYKSSERDWVDTLWRRVLQWSKG